MVVIHIIEALGGGVYTYFKDLTDFFSKDKNTTTIVIYNGNRKEVTKESLSLLKKENVEMIEVEMNRNINLKKDFIAISKIRKIIKKHNPDIVHLHSSKASVLGRIACFNLLKRTCIFYTPHSYSFINPEFSKVQKKIFYLIEKYVQFFFGGITIACGDTEFEYASNIGKSLMVRNGIPVEKTHKHTIIPSNKTLTIGILGRITTIKNPKLFNEIARRFPKYSFKWIGDGDLRELITAPNIEITGWSLDTETVMSRLGSLDVYLQTSICEGLPIALLEAMALEKPIVATNIIGNKDIVSHNQTGYLFEEIEELDTYFKSLESEEFRNKMGKNGLERCYLLFDVSKNLSGLKSIYLDAIKK